MLVHDRCPRHDSPVAQHPIQFKCSDCHPGKKTHLCPPQTVSPMLMTTPTACGHQYAKRERNQVRAAMLFTQQVSRKSQKCQSVQLLERANPLPPTVQATTPRQTFQPKAQCRRQISLMLPAGAQEGTRQFCQKSLSSKQILFRHKKNVRGEKVGNKKNDHSDHLMNRGYRRRNPTCALILICSCANCGCEVLILLRCQICLSDVFCQLL